MSMTMEEIIKKYEVAVEGGKQIAPLMGEDAKEIYEMLKAGLSALRGPTREQVEKVWRSEWAYPACEWNLPKCPKCGCNSKDATYGHKNNFCPRCGRPMTDEAVEMVMKRLEALKDDWLGGRGA